MKSKIQATVTQKGYDALQPVVDFNETSGNTCEKRNLDSMLPMLYENLLAEEYDEFLSAKTLEDTLDSLADITVIAAGMIHVLGYNPNEVMKAVNESNMSKFCDTESDAIKSVEQYEGDSRYVNVHYRLVNGRYVIYGQKLGGDGWKILKGIHYHEPQFNL